MPHLIYECSEEIASTVSFESLFVNIHHLLAEQLPTQINSCKSRMIGYQQSFVGADNTMLFMHVSVKVMSGRSNALKQQVGNKLLQIMTEFFESHHIKNVSTSIEFIDLTENYLKLN